MNESKTNQCVSVLNVYNRERLDVTGVLEIISSSDKEIYAKMENTFLQVLGKNLTITKLIPEEKLLSVGGMVDGVLYQSKQNKKSFFGKVFK